MPMKRRPNNSGTVGKASGNRVRPYFARLPAREVWDKDKCKVVTKRPSIGYYETESQAWKALHEYQVSHPDEFSNDRKNIECHPNKKVLFSDLWNKYIESKPYQKISASTKGNYKAVYNKHLISLHYLPIEDIKTSMLEDIIDNIDGKSGTKKNALTVVRKLMDLAISDDIITKNYADYVYYENDEVEISREIFTYEEINKIWDHRDEWICQILLIMIYSGARITEVINIKNDDVHMDEEYFHVNFGKNKFAVRDVPIHSSVLSLFRILCRNTSDYLIKDESGHFIKPRRVQDYLYRIREITGKDHYVYDAKHTFITQCAICNVSEIKKINIIGHTPNSTSEKYYTHLPIQDLKKELEKVIYSPEI